MPLEAVKNRSLADQVFAQLATEIVGSRYQPGAALPSERELAEVFGVNRHVVREALKRLAQASLVKIAQGGHTRVLDYRRHAGLEMLTLFAEYANGNEQVVGHWLAVLEMRASMAAEVVRLCALRASPELRKELVEITEKMRLSGDSQEIYTLEVRFWERALEGANNIAYQLAFNSLIKSAIRMGHAAREMSVQEVKNSGYRVSLAEAIAAGDAERAETETRTRMRGDLETLTKLLEQRGAPERGAAVASAANSAGAQAGNLNERPGAAAVVKVTRSLKSRRVEKP
jgi:GntR family transcriptional repressor for pyruvate dehydrogenase complex